MKTCSKCNEIKPLEAFSKVNKTADKRRSRCKPCCITHTKEWRKLNPRKTIERTMEWQQRNKDKVRVKSQAYLLKKKFNLTVEEYNLKLSQQGEVCAICKCKCKSGRNLAVDHNHKTGENRGLLCGNCNIALGHLQENTELLISMIKYIQLYEKSK